MNKKLFLTLLALLLVGFVSASKLNDDVSYKEKISKTYYNVRDDYTITRTVEANYDNKDRASTYDYRHGYSYRKTADYWADKHEAYLDDSDMKGYYNYRINQIDNNRDYRNYGYDDQNYYYDDGDAGNRIQYRYIPYMKSVEERKCFDYVPRGKLFYISCNDWLY